MAPHFVAADFPVLHHPVSRTAKGILKPYRTRFQTGGRCDCLKCRTRFIGIVNASVPPHLVQRVLAVLIRHRSAVRPGIQGKGVIQVKLRYIYHGKDFPVLRIHQQDSHFIRLLFLHDLFCHLLGVHLDIIVQADLQRIARHRLHPVFRHAVKFHPPGVRRGQDRSVLPFQVLLVLHFQPYDSLIIPSRKAKNLGSKLVIGVVAFEIFIYLHAVKFHITDIVPGLLIHVRLNPLHGGHLLHTLTDCRLIHLKGLRQRLNYLLRLPYLAVDYRYGADRLVGGQYFAPGVQYLAPGRLDFPLSLVKVFCLLLIVFCIEHHQIDKPPHQRQDNHGRNDENHQDLTLIICFIFHNAKTSQKLFV